MLKLDNYLKILKDEERLKNNRLVWEGENKWTQYIQQEFQNQTGGALYYQIKIPHSHKFEENKKNVWKFEVFWKF